MEAAEKRPLWIVSIVEELAGATASINYLGAQGVSQERQYAACSQMLYQPNKFNPINQFVGVDGLDSKTPRPHWKRPGLGLRSA